MQRVSRTTQATSLCETYGAQSAFIAACEDFDALNLEHRHNDGNIDKRRGLSGQKLYRYLRAQGIPGALRRCVRVLRIIKQIQGVDYLLVYDPVSAPNVVYLPCSTPQVHPVERLVSVFCFGDARNTTP
jgi:hypothetical protein